MFLLYAMLHSDLTSILIVWYGKYLSGTYLSGTFHSYLYIYLSETFLCFCIGLVLYSCLCLGIYSARHRPLIVAMSGFVSFLVC